MNDLPCDVVLARMCTEGDAKLSTAYGIQLAYSCIQACRKLVSPVYPILVLRHLFSWSAKELIT